MNIFKNLVKHHEEFHKKYKTRLINKKHLIKELVDEFSENEVTEQQLSTILSGFTLTSKNLSERKIYSPKQEYRALRRAFFEAPYDNDCHILFSAAMAAESLIELQCSFCFKKSPSEWLSTNPKIEKPLGLLSNATGKFFEDMLANEYKQKGIRHINSIKKLKSKKHTSTYQVRLARLIS